MFAGAAVGDLELSAGQFDFDGGIEPAVTSAYRDCCARARSTGERFADATLEHAQLDMGFVDDLHEPDVHTLREARMTLDRRSETIHGRAGDRCDREHCVRIAHGYRADLDLGARQ